MFVRFTMLVGENKKEKNTYNSAYLYYEVVDF